MTFQKPTLDEFIATLSPDVLSSKTFIDWTRIHEFLEDYRREIALIGSLSKDKPVEDLADLLLRFPRILLLLQQLIASSSDDLGLADGFLVDFKKDQVLLKAGGAERAGQIAKTFAAVGLVDELLAMKSVFDYSKGVLVGLEPNKHKNRRGEVFQSQVGALLEQAIAGCNKELPFELQMRQGRETGMMVKSRARPKYPDFAVFSTQQARMEIAVEANFYVASGSKPLETLTSAYPEVQRNLAQQGISLIVISDGTGWKRMRSALSVALQELKYPMNLALARGGGTPHSHP